ncbi:MFS transporter [Paenibacillus antri]|nr:MFS transporter [Paenibacillus antri]
MGNPMGNMGSRTISALVRNRPGVLAGISAQFALADCNIDRLTVSADRDPALAWMKISAKADDRTLSTLLSRLEAMQEVLSVRARDARKETMAYGTVAYCLFVVIFGINLASPIYSIYKETWDLTPAMVTALFAAYAFPVIPSIVLFGQMAHRLGPRRILGAGLAFAAIGSLGLAVADGYGWMLAARTMQGVAVGMFNGVAVGAMTDLHATRDRRTAAFAAAAMVTAGNALGPVASGSLAEFAPMPTVLPYALHLLMLAAAMAGLAFVEMRTERVPRSRLHLPFVPPGLRLPFATASASSFIAWSAVSLFLSVVPSYLDEWVGRSGYLVSGCTAAFVLGLSVLGQRSMEKMPVPVAASFGCAFMAFGLVSLFLSNAASSSAWLVASAACVGLGHGPLYAVGLGAVNRISPDAARADLISLYYAITYVGVSLPVMGLGLAAQRLDWTEATGWWTAAMLVLLALVWRGWMREARFRPKEFTDR